MKVLMIDTSTANLYVRFFESQSKEVLFSKDMVSHNNHSENLLVVIEEGLNKTNMKLKDFNKIIVGVGPGSYTGVRISMVVAKMASFSLNIPLYTISSLTFCASGYLVNDGIYGTSIVAKKDHCYGNIISVNTVNNNQEISIIDNDCFLKTQEFISLASERKAEYIDDGKYLINEEIIDKLAVAVEDIHNLVPNYLRKANS